MPITARSRKTSLDCSWSSNSKILTISRLSIVLGLFFLGSLTLTHSQTSAGSGDSSVVAPSTVTAPTGTTTATSPNYILSPNDLLDIRVFQEDDLRTLTRVPQDGVINFPLVGSIKIGGKSVAQATELIRSKLQSDFLVNPQVNLTITEYAKRRFSIIGQVQKPGSYDIPDESKITLLDAIAMAGGFTRIANQSDITVKRISQGQETIYRLNASRMAKAEGSKAFKVEEGDTIYIKESIF